MAETVVGSVSDEFVISFRTPFFLFVNPTAGGNRAQGFMDLAVKHGVPFNVAETNYECYIYDIREGSPGDKKVYAFLLDSDCFRDSVVSLWTSLASGVDVAHSHAYRFDTLAEIRGSD